MYEIQPLSLLSAAGALAVEEPRDGEECGHDEGQLGVLRGAEAQGHEPIQEPGKTTGEPDPLRPAHGG